MDDHIFVFGSNSFSGAHFVNHALKRGYRVTGVSRSPESNPVFLPYINDNGKAPESFLFIQADLNQDVDRLLEYIVRDKPAYIVNFAAQGMVAESWEHPEQWLRTNSLSLSNFCNKLLKFSFLRKFVQISTPEVYGSTSGYIKENVHYEPSTPYAVSKAAADMMLTCFHKSHGFPVVFTRAANVYGPCQQLYRIIPRAVLRFLTGGCIDLHGGGHSMRAFIHISDVAEATLDIMEQASSGSIFHISTKETISIRELVFRIARMVGVDPEKHINIVADRLGKDSAYSLDCSALRETLGWTDKVDLDQGITEVVDWVRINMKVLLALPQNYIHKP
jgi:dTDP-glucose 4,6-dehydratase